MRIGEKLAQRILLDLWFRSNGLDKFVIQKKMASKLAILLNNISIIKMGSNVCFEWQTYPLRRGLSILKGGNSRVYPYPSKGKGRVGFQIFPKGIEGQSTRGGQPSRVWKGNYPRVRVKPFIYHYSTTVVCIKVWTAPLYEASFFSAL